MITKEVNIVVKETGLDQVQKQVNKLDASLENLSDTNKGVAKSMGESSNAVLDNGGAMGLLNDATGGLAMTVKDAVEASWLFTKSQKAASVMTAIQTTVIGTSTGAMKAFRIALAATGIGLIVIGLGLLIANFDKVKKVVLNLVPGLAAVGDFITGIVESITDFIGVTSEAERALAELTAQADKSLAMNKKFMAEQGDVLNDYTKQKIDAKNRYLEAVKEEGADQKALAARLNRELLAIDNKHNDDLAKIRKDKQDKLDEANKAAAEKSKQEREKELQKRLDERKSELEKFNDVEKEFEAQREEKRINNLIKEEEDKNKTVISLEEVLKARQNGLEAEKKANENRIADEELVRDAKFQIANSVFDMVNMFAKKGSKLSKGVAAAQATMNTYQGVTAALAAPSTIPEPFGTALKIANSVAIGAMGFMNVKKILSTNEQGGGGGSTSSGGSIPSAPSFNLVQGTGSNQIASSINTQQPIEAFVVSKNVSTGQELDRNIIKSASL